MDQEADLQGAFSTLRTDALPDSDNETAKTVPKDKPSLKKKPECYFNSNKNGDASVKAKKGDTRGAKASNRKLRSSKHPSPCCQSLCMHEARPGNTINIVGSSNIHVGNVVNVSGSVASPFKSKQPKMEKTKEIEDLLSDSAILEMDDMMIIAGKLGKGWRTVGWKLGYYDGQLDHFEVDNLTSSGLDEVIMKMLLDWKQVNPKVATVGAICNALWKAKEYEVVTILAENKS